MRFLDEFYALMQGLDKDDDFADRGYRIPAEVHRRLVSLARHLQDTLDEARQKYGALEDEYRRLRDNQKPAEPVQGKALMGYREEDAVDVFVEGLKTEAKPTRVVLVFADGSTLRIEASETTKGPHLNVTGTKP